MSLQSRGVSRVERGSKNSGMKMGSPAKGNGYPRQVGIEPKVVRGDALTPILPKGMDSGRVVDGSAGGESVSFRQMGIDAGV